MATINNNQNVFNPQQVINNATAPAKGKLPTFAYALQALMQPGMAFGLVKGKKDVPYTLIRVTASSVVLCPQGYPVPPANYVRKRLTPALLNNPVFLFATKHTVNTIATALQAQLGANPVFAPLNGNFLPVATYIINHILPDFCCTDAADRRVAIQLVWEYLRATYPVGNKFTKGVLPAINAVFAQVLKQYVK